MSACFRPPVFWTTGTYLRRNPVTAYEIPGEWCYTWLARESRRVHAEALRNYCMEKLKTVEMCESDVVSCQELGANLLLKSIHVGWVAQQRPNSASQQSGRGFGSSGDE
ncbi:MAG: hypothetical protein Q9198_011092, partial [Flavoplaca austrocitrina]